MAHYNDVLGVLRDYRNVLEQSIQQESNDLFAGLSSGEMSTFSARGGTAAFTTPLSNIHATGVGIRLRRGKILKDDFVLKVYVFDKLNMKADTPELTKQYKGIDVDVEALPIQLALTKGTSSPLDIKKPTIEEHRSKHKPIIGGISIAPLNEAFVGTLGCFLSRNVSGIRQIFALSNNHVLADTNRLPIGTQIVQPGPEVGPTTPDDVFGALADFIPIDFPSGRLSPSINTFDAAIAVVPDETLITTSKILGIDNFNPSVGVAVPGMRVIKSGRTTGVTTGIVTATRVNGTQVNYGTRIAPRIATFNDTIQIISDKKDSPFSAPGDSGSVIIDQDTGQPVALLFAGDGVTTTACDLGGVCRHFQAFPI